MSSGPTRQQPPRHACAAARPPRIVLGRSPSGLPRAAPAPALVAPALAAPAVGVAPALAALAVGVAPALEAPAVGVAPALSLAAPAVAVAARDMSASHQRTAPAANRARPPPPPSAAAGTQSFESGSKSSPLLGGRTRRVHAMHRRMCGRRVSNCTQMHTVACLAMRAPDRLLVLIAITTTTVITSTTRPHHHRSSLPAPGPVLAHLFG